MNDDDKVKDFGSFDHAWAESPKTIGSISMMFMGFMIMREMDPNELGYNYQEMVIQNNIKKIVEKDIFPNIKNNL